MTTPTTNPETNIALIRAGFEDFNAGDFDACVACVAPGFGSTWPSYQNPCTGPTRGVKARR